jgi:hypothetical protein
VIRRLQLEWPDRQLFADGRGAVRILAVSDAVDSALTWSANRDSLGHIDLVVGCGDLEPEALAFVIDAVGAPSIHVRGNHDTGAGWSEGLHMLPSAARSGVSIRPAAAGGVDIEVLPLGWAGAPGVMARRDEGAAWRHVLGWSARRALRRRTGRPFVVVSHAPPLGAGDAADPYHRGFRAYRWLMERARPVLWLHGHTPLVAIPWLVTCGQTTLVNATGAVLVELVPPTAPPGGAS